VLAVSETARRCSAMAVTEDAGWHVHFFCWCSSDGAVLGIGCGCFSLRHGVMTVQLLSTSIFDLSQTYVSGH